MTIFKKIISAVCATAMAVTVMAQTAAVFAAGNDKGGPVSYYGQMQASAGKINGSKTNRPMQVKGMSFFWSNWSSQFWNRQTVERMTDEFKCEIVRCAYGVNDGGSPYDYSDEARLRQVVEAAIDEDIYVIIDWHSHGAHLNPGAAKDFFTRMAKDYGSYDNVIFEVFNEPTTVSWSTVKWYAEQVIPCIRQYSDNLIIVGTPTWSQDVDAAADNPISDSNLAYVLHFYAGSHFQYLRDKANYALSRNMSLFVSEWGSVNADGNGGINYGSTEEWLNWMNEKQLSWCNWAINSKDETSSIFYNDGSLREAGKYLKSILNGSAEYAEWRKGSVSGGGSAPDTEVNPGKDITITLPGVIEAEDYAYMSGIETESCTAGGKNIGYTDDGDWLSYNIMAEKSGSYKVKAYIAGENGGRLSIETNEGKNVLSTIDIPATGGWQNWQTVETEIKLEAGEYSLGLAIAKGGFNIDKLEITYTESSDNEELPPDEDEPITLPSQDKGAFTVEAEDYDYMSGIETENCVNGGKNVGYIDAGDWMSYNVSFPDKGKYKVQFTVASERGGMLSLEADSGNIKFADVNIPATGGWQNWQTVTAEIEVKEKEYNLGIGTSTGGFNIDKFTFIPMTQNNETDKDDTDISDNKKISFTLEAENYAYMSGIETENCVNGGKNVGYIDAGDWMSYNVSFPDKGKYKVQFTVASERGGMLSLEADSGNIKFADVNIPATGGWQNWQTVTAEIEVKGTEYNLGIGTSTGGFNIDKIIFTKAA